MQIILVVTILSARALMKIYTQQKKNTLIMQETGFIVRNAMFLRRYAEAGSTARKGIVQPARTTQYVILIMTALIKDGLAQSSAIICRYTKTISMENASAKNALMPQNQFK